MTSYFQQVKQGLRGDHQYSDRVHAGRNQSRQTQEPETVILRKPRHTSVRGAYLAAGFRVASCALAVFSLDANVGYGPSKEIVNSAVHTALNAVNSIYKPSV